jgi:hypothetical protein
MRKIPNGDNGKLPSLCGLKQQARFKTPPNSTHFVHNSWACKKLVYKSWAAAGLMVLIQVKFDSCLQPGLVQQ